MRKIAGVLSLILCLSFGLCGCNAKKDTASYERTVTKTDKPEGNSDILTENTIEAIMTLTNGETIELELYPDIAPKTVANFVKNVQEGFYGGTIFHRVIKGFVIQGGGYDEDFNRKSVSETVEGEFETNGIENELKHVRGVLSMARTSEPNSASTQFFIMHEDAQYLDGQYAAFGRVVSGMEVVDEIASSPISDENPDGLEDVPENIYVIDSIVINTEE